MPVRRYEKFDQYIYINKMETDVLIAQPDHDKNISIPEKKYSYVYIITMSINISIPERKYSYVCFITMFIDIR
jgi:hypothetical protein